MAGTTSTGAARGVVRPPEATRSAPVADRSVYSRIVSDLPVQLPEALAARLAAAFDVEGKIARAIEALAPVAGRDVALLDGDSAGISRRLAEMGARVHPIDWDDTMGHAQPATEPWADALVSCWTGFRGFDPAEVQEAGRIVRTGGRLLVVHDYGRDDVSQLHGEDGDRPEYGAWSRRDGPFLANGFKVRVVHCWWTFDTVEETREFLAEGFGDAGRALGESLKRPRLSYNVAIYHRTLGEGPAPRA